MNHHASLPPEQQRPALHKLIDELPAADLALVECLLARLEMDRLWQDVRQGFTQDWADGKYDQLDDFIQQAREDLRI
jgi:hypothetical protein